jgi:hypothetical protein
MRRTMLSMTAFAATLMVGSMLSPANASPFGPAAALVGAAEDIAVVDNVHCRPGWRHHEPSRWRRADGCGRRGGVVVLPGRDRYVIRDGVRVRVGSSRDRDVRSRTTIRTETTGRRSVRSGEGREGRTMRSGEGGMSKGGTTGQRGRGGGQAPTQQQQQKPQ